MENRERLEAELNDATLVLLAQLRQAGSVAFSSLGLTYGQAMLLMFVEQGYTRPKELTGLLGVVFSAFSALVTNLVGSGFLLRELDPTDGRRVEVRLTPEGREMCDRIRAAWRDVNPLRTSAIDEADARALLRVVALMLPQD